jgi:acyl-CoA synthetase (AMP-forming)/AMP-acid ligase II
MVIRGGENISCAEVEAAVYEHPSVKEAAVFGVPDERLGEQVRAHNSKRERCYVSHHGLVGSHAVRCTTPNTA